MISRNYDEKLWRYLGGQPPSAEFSRLISSDPAVAQRLAELALIECTIREAATANMGRRIIRQRRSVLIGAAAVFVGIALTFFLSWRILNDRPVAGMPMAADGDFEGEGIVSEMREGGAIRVSDKPLRMVFSGEETDLVFEPDSEVRFEESGEGGKSIHLKAGRLDARVSPQKALFKVKTPHLSVEVLGTTFDVLVSAVGSHVLVDEGTVAVEAKSLDEPLHLSRASGWKESAQGRGHSLAKVAYTETPPQIDRRNDSLWSSQPKMVTGFHEGESVPERDHSSSWKAVWNEEALFILIEVADDKADGSHDQVWANDSAEIFIDADNSRGAQFDGINDHFLFFEPGVEVITPGIGALAPRAGMVHQSHRTPQGFRVEVKLPWAELGITPEAGVELGFNVASNDSDGDERGRSQLSWTPKSGNDWSRPDRMGLLILTRP